MTAAAAGDLTSSKLCFWDFRNFVARFPYKRLGRPTCCQPSPRHASGQKARPTANPHRWILAGILCAQTAGMARCTPANQNTRITWKLTN